MPRLSSRSFNQMRAIKVTKNYITHPHGSVLFQMGGTRVLCSASIDNKVPSFLRGQGRGWVTAEYGMLPRATNTRMDREAARGRQSGRTLEIQRLIGRSLRAVVKLDGFGERQLRVDCDVIQADGGTRTAAITGSYVALHRAFEYLVREDLISSIPLIDQVAGISCGVFKGDVVVDLDYAEDSSAEADANFVVTSSGGLVELQATGERGPFTRSQFERMLKISEAACAQLFALQLNILRVSKAPSA